MNTTKTALSLRTSIVAAEERATTPGVEGSSSGTTAGSESLAVASPTPVPGGPGVGEASSAVGYLSPLRPTASAVSPVVVSLVGAGETAALDAAGRFGDRTAAALSTLAGGVERAPRLDAVIGGVQDDVGGSSCCEEPPTSPTHPTQETPR